MKADNKTHRIGWYFAEDKTFTIPVLLSVGPFSESDSEICQALSEVAHFTNIPETIAPCADGVDPDSCKATHCTIVGPFGPVQIIQMRDFDFCNGCVSTLSHELFHAVRAAFIDRNVYVGVEDRACESFAYSFSGLFKDLLDKLESGDGWVPNAVSASSETGCAHNKKGKKNEQQ